MDERIIRVGMSGFSYPEWKGVFYPSDAKPKDFLRLYSGRLGAVEINATYRRMPTEELVSKWRDAVGEDFRFALKANQRITHIRRLRDTADDVSWFMDGSAALGPRRGPVLFQLPPTFRFDRDRIETFCSSLPSGGLYAIEPRSKDFDDDAFFEVLAAHGVAHCLNDEFFDPAAYRVTAPFAYLRLRKEEYTRAELDDRRDVALRLASEGAEVYAFFMHEDDPRAAMQAVVFQDLVAGREPPPLPPKPPVIEPDDIVAAAALCRDALEPHLGADWTVNAGELEWDCRHTLDHISDALLYYAVHLATRAKERLPPVHDGLPGAGIPHLLQAVTSSAAVLAEVARAAPPRARAFHPAGMADASGFLAMGCDEVLIHTSDISLGLGIEFRPPDDLCDRLTRRLFPWAPAGGDPWETLRWANGRTDLLGHERLGPDWYWQCAPLDEWDGTPRKRNAPPKWT